MRTLIIQSNSKSNMRLLSEMARKLGDKVIENNGKTDKIETYLASENSLAKEWLTTEEDKAWENL